MDKVIHDANSEIKACRTKSKVWHVFLARNRVKLELT